MDNYYTRMATALTAMQEALGDAIMDTPGQKADPTSVSLSAGEQDGIAFVMITGSKENISEIVSMLKGKSRSARFGG
jgi:BioD-like phosphotransacetylase family protein